MVWHHESYEKAEDAADALSLLSSEQAELAKIVYDVDTKSYVIFFPEEFRK